MQMHTPHSRIPAVESSVALTLHSLALFTILFQFRLISRDMADGPVFVTTLLAGFMGGLSFALTVKAPLVSFSGLVLVPWICRFFISMPRYFAPDLAVSLDSLLLNLDRNYFVVLIPYYWAAFSTAASFKSRTFLRASIVAGMVLLLIVYSMARTVNIGLYRFPVVMILIFSGLLLLEAAALLFSLPREVSLRRGEILPAAAVLVLLALLGGFLFLKPSQERAVEQGGGLLEPKLFSFDFSQFLRLETEISMKDDLVFIVKKDSEDSHILLRRYVLSGYSRKQGFFRMEGIDEKTHPQRLPGTRTRFDDPGPIRDSRLTNQEYYLVNFDSAAFIGMNAPLEVLPFETWDTSSFSSAYAVQSRVCEALSFELYDSLLEPPGAENLGLSAEEYALYTEYGGDQRLAAYAREITEGLDFYWEKVDAVYEWLKYGDYRYSLKPGIAPDGDQLSYFLFESKKGYCSYYAFSMALLLRSIGIPARVGAGFFINPEENTFDYYPVRSNMAHAWVEVPFPGYGWMEFDPTSDELAAGEEFRFSSGDQSQFERLMKEILDNHSKLRAKEGTEEEREVSVMDNFLAGARRVLQSHWPFIILIILPLFFLWIRCGKLLRSRILRKDRKKALLLWAHVRRRLSLAGLRRRTLTGEAEWAKSVEDGIGGTYALYQGAAAARFAPEYGPESLRAMQDAYRVFSAAYRDAIPLWRRVLAWILPPLALFPGVPKGSTGKNTAVLIFFSLLLFSLGGGGRAQDAFPLPDELFQEAVGAEEGEFWERAIELYSRGKELYPIEPRFPWALGNLYFGRSLYTLAWEEYRITENLIPDNPDILFRLSRTAAYLNEDRVSVDYLERVLALNPDDREAISNLGWMYYKVHRLVEGQQLMLRAMERFGPDSDFAMTLGTLYADNFNYDEGKKWYLEAIAGGERAGDRVFTAVAHYNLSILETRFYRFGSAFDRTNAALASQDRASGHLARGEAYLRQMDFNKALEDYEAAYDSDTSPLSKVNLAQVYQISGRLETARLYAEDCLKGSDLSWMLNYGIDPVRYRRDLHEILYKTYGGLEKSEVFKPAGSLSEAAGNLIRRIHYRFKYEVHRRLYKKYCLLSADAYRGESFAGGEQHLDALIQYYNAFEDYPKRALSYLRRARDFETNIIPAALPSYKYEEGKLFKNRAQTAAALEGFDPVWEQDMIADAYTDLAKFSRGPQKHEAAEELYAINRGGLRQEGLRLPAELSVQAGERALTRHLTRLVKRSGVETVDGARYSISLELSLSPGDYDYSIRCELQDRSRNATVLRRSFPLPSLSKKDLAACIRAIGDTIFTEE
jgi:transglutaminase-like putative cysteine protease/tetratricopeptide (TPR) repeat protein